VVYAVKMEKYYLACLNETDGITDGIFPWDPL
jgi:hypothetical protein